MTFRNYAAAFVALFLFACSQAAFATAYQGRAYEPFAYTDRAQIISQNNLSGGNGFNATGDVLAANLTGWGGIQSNPGKVIKAPSLTYAGNGYPSSSGNRAVMDSIQGGSTISVPRDIGQTVDSGTFYFSYLTRLDNTTKCTNTFGLFGPANGIAGTPGNTTERVSIGQIGVANASPNTPGQTNGNFGVLFNNLNPNTGTNNVVNASSPIALTPNVVHLIIGRVDFNPAGNDTFTMYVDPSDVSTEPLIPYIQTNAYELTSFNSISLLAATAATIDGVSNPAAQANFDEIRLGSTWAAVTTAVVPEPTTLVLAVVGGIGICLHRKRRLN